MSQTRRTGTARYRKRHSRRPPKGANKSRRASKRIYWRRRGLLLLGIAAILTLLGVGGSSLLNPAIREIKLPLRHDDIIRQQAKAKKLDPALIAAVIYAESRFRPRTSSAGAKGLMQLLPSTANFIASKSGGSAFEEGDLATPQINISYGAFYLRYLLDSYHGNEFLALSAYNAGQGRVSEWIARGKARGNKFDSVEEIPFPETRAYVVKVLSARDRYRSEYAHELGI